MLLHQRHFSPDNPGGDGQPNPNPESKPTFDPSTLPPFLQKYPGNTLEERMKNADAGYWNMVNHSKEIMSKVDPLVAKAKAYDQLQVAINGSPTPQASAVERLAGELGVSVDLVAGALNEVAGSTFTNVLGPVLGEYTATESLAAEIGDDFAKIKPQVGKWLSENPDEKQRFDSLRQNGFAREAWELAIRKWGATQPGPTPGGKGAAGIPGSTQSSPTRQAATGPDPEKLRVAAEYHQTYGDWRPMAHERFKGTSVGAAVENMQNYIDGIGL